MAGSNSKGALTAQNRNIVITIFPLLSVPCIRFSSRICVICERLIDAKRCEGILRRVFGANEFIMRAQKLRARASKLRQTVRIIKTAPRGPHFASRMNIRSREGGKGARSPENENMRFGARRIRGRRA